MKQIARFSKPEEAEMLRAFLETSGVSAYVRDAHTVTVDWALSDAIGGVKVDVADEDAERAIALLKELEPPSPPRDPTKEKQHSVGRYMVIAVALSIIMLIVLTFVVGFDGDFPPTYLVFSSVTIGVGVAFFCALYDL